MPPVAWNIMLHASFYHGIWLDYDVLPIFAFLVFCLRQHTTMRNPSIFIVALRHVKNRQALPGLNGHATFEEPSLGNITAPVSI